MGGAYPGDRNASTWMKNPLFVNPAGGDYSLQPGSPLIDAGANLQGIVDEDYAGASRPAGSAFDIGAYESQRSPVTISGNVGAAGVTLTYTASAAKTVSSDAGGNYSFNVPYNWSGSITPAKTYYTFFPQSVQYTSVTTDQDVQDFTYEISTFADVKTTYWAQPQIESFYNAGITSGCGADPRVYCPSRPVTRAEMAVFILRAKDGTSTPVPGETGLFSDVPVGGKEWMQPWIEQFYLEHISVGCNSDPVSFCPERETTRAEIAVFILRAVHGANYQPPAATGIFSDVPVTGNEWMQPWVEEFYREKMTTGCTQEPLNYCPEQPVTRAEMAVFIDRAFDY